MATSLYEASSEAASSSLRDTSIVRWLKWLTVAMFLVALALLFVVSAVFGAIVDFHAGEGILIAGASSGGAVVGFLFGWIARRAVE
jgi:hypothetical protein